MRPNADRTKKTLFILDVWAFSGIVCFSSFQILRISLLKRRGLCCPSATYLLNVECVIFCEFSFRFNDSAELHCIFNRSLKRSIAKNGKHLLMGYCSLCEAVFHCYRWFSKQTIVDRTLATWRNFRIFLQPVKSDGTKFIRYFSLEHVVWCRSVLLLFRLIFYDLSGVGR